jgi:hypothetical protein
MHSYIDLYFAPDGVSPLEIADRIREHTGLTFIMGAHDLAFEWSSIDEFRTTLAKVHKALEGTGVVYRVETVQENPGFVDPIPWPPPFPGSPSDHPGF